MKQIMKENPNMVYLKAHAIAKKTYNYNQLLKEWKEANK